MENKYDADLIVIGAGASGLICAGHAAELGLKVLLLERGPRVGRKLAIAGKGRCNVCSDSDMQTTIAAFGTNGRFLYGPLTKFGGNHIRELLLKLGVPTKVERGGRVFPESDEAEDVVYALERYVRKAKAQIVTDTRVSGLQITDGRIAGVKLGSRVVTAPCVAICTGGVSYPLTGSTGDGYGMAEQAGHTIEPIHPSLTGMVTVESWPAMAQGLTLKNVKARLYSLDEEGNRHRVAQEFGELLFTHFGVSGPVILTLSRQVPAVLEQGKVMLTIDLKPALDEATLDARLIRELVGAKWIVNYLPDLLPRSLIQPFLLLNGIPHDTPMSRITLGQRRQMVAHLKQMTLHVKALRPADEAIVTSGGVNIKEIDPRTMMSKLVDGLFLCGEVIDIDAITGGYNLMAAWSTGWVAAEGAAKRLQEGGVSTPGS